MTDRARWLVLAVFVLSTAINYLDRATLAAVAPAVMNEFHLNDAQYGWTTGGVMMGEQRLSLLPSGRELDFETGYGFSAGGWNARADQEDR